MRQAQQEDKGEECPWCGESAVHWDNVQGLSVLLCVWCDRRPDCSECGEWGKHTCPSRGEVDRPCQCYEGDCALCASCFAFGYAEHLPMPEGKRLLECAKCNGWYIGPEDKKTCNDCG